jgi:hypothetical protein
VCLVARRCSETVFYLDEINDQQQAGWRKTLEMFESRNNAIQS